MQIFTKAPMAAKMREVTEDEARAFSASPYRKEITDIVVHASYLLNFAKPQSKDAYERRSLAEDLRSIEKLGGQGVVLHMGKYLGVDPAIADALFVENLLAVLEDTKKLKVPIILENTAGQGTEMGWQLEEYGHIFKKFKKNKRIRSCIDTAHLSGAGYDLGTPAGAKATIKKLEEHVGIENIVCVHFNDSKKPIGARVDRHQDIGYGTLKVDGLREFMRGLHKQSPSLPFILETPQEHATYTEQIALVKSWF